MAPGTDHAPKSVPGRARMRTGLALWTVAMVYSFFRPSLWLLDLVAIPLMWIFAIAGLACIAAGAFVAASEREPDGRRSFRRAGRPALLIAAVLLVTATVGAWWQLAPRAWFTTHRALYAQALSTDPGPDYYGNALPLPLRFLSVGGKVSAGPDGARFFPQWIGTPDDAGGYWHSPARSPAGNDMYGMICTDPVPLGDDWWMCGMRD